MVYACLLRSIFCACALLNTNYDRCLLVNLCAFEGWNDFVSPASACVDYGNEIENTFTEKKKKKKEDDE